MPPRWVWCLRRRRTLRGYRAGGSCKGTRRRLFPPQGGPNPPAVGMITRSPALSVRTSGPTASTRPMASWPMRPPGVAAFHFVVGPEVAAAHAGASGGNQRVRRMDKLRVGDVFDPGVAGAKLMVACMAIYLLLTAGSVSLIACGIEDIGLSQSLNHLAAPVGFLRKKCAPASFAGSAKKVATRRAVRTERRILQRL